MINFQLMSAALTRSVAPAGTAPTDYNQGPFDTYLAIYDSSGNVIAYNDDSFQDTDSTIIDLTLPDHGHLLRDGDLFPQVGVAERAVDRGLRALHVHVRHRRRPARRRHDVRRLGRRHDHRRLGRRHDRGPAPGHDHLRLGHRDRRCRLPPTLNVSAGPNQTVNEGTSVTLTGSFLDPSGDATHTYDWHVVASSGQRSPTGPAPPSRSPRATPAPTPSLTPSSDPNGGWDSAEVVITSNAVPPVLTAPTASQSVYAGVSTSINLGTLAVTGVGPLTDTVQWGDGQTSTFSPAGSGPLSLAHTYATAGTYTISETVSEYDGDSTTASFSINVTQRPPRRRRSASSTASAVYGQSLTFTATVTGPGTPTGTVAFYAGRSHRPIRSAPAR